MRFDDFIVIFVPPIIALALIVVGIVLLVLPRYPKYSSKKTPFMIIGLVLLVLGIIGVCLLVVMWVFIAHAAGQFFSWALDGLGKLPP